jgi:threonine aldolase
MIHALDGVNGIFDPDQALSALRPKSRYMPESRLLCVEQTANLGGGAIWPANKLRAVAAVAKEHGLSTHMDGARLMNAVVKSGISAREWARDYDSCWIDFSKGLGAPMGAVLAGSNRFIERAWRIKQQIGGAMRQSGVVSAMCLYALEHHVDRLADDHLLAASLARRLSSYEGIKRVLPVETNIIILDLEDDGPDAAWLVSAMRMDGVLIGAFGARRLRIVTHLDVDEAGGDALCASMRRQLTAKRMSAV